jgi:hypothetical protein
VAEANRHNGLAPTPNAWTIAKMTPPNADLSRSAILQLGKAAVVWWSPLSGQENVGDFLSFYFVNRLFKAARVDADVYRLVGSVITATRIQKDVASIAGRSDARIAFWGCGCREDEALPPDALAHASFHGVRGPLTRRVLGLSPDTPLGDPGLLLPLLHVPGASERTRNRTIFVPHILDVLRTPQEMLQQCSEADLLVSPIVENTLPAVEQFIDDICSADFVMAGSLHAAIIACAYGVPFSYFDTGYIDQPFKWRDFSASIGTGTYFPRTRGDAETVYRQFLNGRIRRPPLAPLLQAAPLEPRDGILERARGHAWPEAA